MLDAIQMGKQPFSTGSSSSPKFACDLFIHVAEVPGREALQPRKGYPLRKKALAESRLKLWGNDQPFDLLARTVLAAPDISGAHFWFQSTRSVVQESSHLWW